MLELDGTLNMFAPGDPRAFRTNLASYPPGSWTVLWDQTGRSLPFAVLRHQAWNWEWQAFQYDHPTASRAEIENQAAQMMEDDSILDRYIHTYREGTGS